MLYRIVTFFSRPLFGLLFRPCVTGLAHLPKAGGCVLSPNHLSGFDVWAVGYALYPRQPRQMGKNELFERPLLGPAIRLLGAFPAHANGVSTAAALAAEGKAVVIFPEGARHRADREHRPRTGAARAAIEAHVPLIPVALRGTDGWRGLARWHVAIGRTIDVDDLTAEDPQRAARVATTRLWTAIEELGAELDLRG